MKRFLIYAQNKDHTKWTAIQILARDFYTAMRIFAKACVDIKEGGWLEDYTEIGGGEL